jgi:hypothetical protein
MIAGIIQGRHLSDHERAVFCVPITVLDQQRVKQRSVSRLTFYGRFWFILGESMGNGSRLTLQPSADMD